MRLSPEKNLTCFSPTLSLLDSSAAAHWMTGFTGERWTHLFGRAHVTHAPKPSRPGAVNRSTAPQADP